MRSIAMLGAIAAFAAAPLAAQATTRGKPDRIPPGQMPPAGMCRIWIDGVPPGRQPAPTDCQTAVARKPTNARVIFGGDGVRQAKAKAHGKLSSQGKGKAKPKPRGDDHRHGNDDHGR